MNSRTQFDIWMEQVDAIIANKLLGLTSEDLGDALTRDMFDNHDTPEEAAENIMDQSDVPADLR